MADADTSECTVPDNPTIGVLGGTGAQGKGLAYRLAKSGLSVSIGSREAQRAQDAAAEVGEGVASDVNDAVAKVCDVAIIAVPWAGHAPLVASLAEGLASKVVIDCVNPLAFDKRGAYRLEIDEGSAAEQAQALLPDSFVVGAFHNVSAPLLNDHELERVETDVLVLGDKRAATDAVQGLVNRIPGMRGIFGGRLRTSAQVEALTANLISINRRYKAHSGIRITDVE